MDPAKPHWHLLGAGNMGTLAAQYLRDAGHDVTAVRRDGSRELAKTLTYADARQSRRLRLPARSPGRIEAPVDHLLVACKTPYTVAALADLALSDDVTVLRLQNGLGSLDGQLPQTATLIEVVTTSAVKGVHPQHQVVAQNQTWMGGATPEPVWFAELSACWPGLCWSEPIRERQWQKLVANAVINPLTGLYDVPNGQLLKEVALRERMTHLAAEADALLGRLDADWPGESLRRVEVIARATAGNTSSMRADMQRGAPTEIDAINGWLLRQAEALGMELPAHRAVVAAVRSRQPGQ